MKKSKYFFLTLDLEEWYHLDYFKHYDLDKHDEFIKGLDPFFNFLDTKGIKITVFVLGELAVKYPELVKEISNRGHEIACHGYDHELLTNKTTEDFKKQVQEAKKQLEEISNQKVVGYRASCFSMDREKLDVLKEIGYQYDSSFIRFAQHSLYNELDMSGFTEVDNLVYENSDFFEFELPTQKFKHLQLPVSGGGYFRIFPTILYKFLFKRFSKGNKNFNFYIHPFEVVEKHFIPAGVTLKDRMRYSLGRKGNLRRLKLFINGLEKEYSFITCRDFLIKIKN